MYPSNRQIELYVSKLQERGEKTLRILGKKQEFIDAVNSKIGRELLGELIDKHEDLFKKIASTESTVNDKIEFQVVGAILASWAGKIAKYDKKCKEIINVANTIDKERKV